jgi:ABC-type lipoprotein release transport system permease subunit
MRLSKRGVLAEGVETAAVGITAQQWWLIILSLTVAVVGIANAMLMSVAERYREIGTMKCLGALDSFIIRLFLLESVFQGTAGTLVGVVLGFLLIWGYTWVTYGWVTMQTFPAADSLKYGLLGFVLGFGLSVLGAILPALRAAKMQPVDAMRVEE